MSTRSQAASSLYPGGGDHNTREDPPHKNNIALDKALFFNQKVSIFFLFLNKNICCGYSLEAPYQGTSNEYLQNMFLLRNKKIIYLIPTLIYNEYLQHMFLLRNKKIIYLIPTLI